MHKQDSKPPCCDTSLQESWVLEYQTFPHQLERGEASETRTQWGKQLFQVPPRSSEEGQCHLAAEDQEGTAARGLQSLRQWYCCGVGLQTQGECEPVLLKDFETVCGEAFGWVLSLEQRHP